MLAARQARVQQGLADANQARVDRDGAAADRDRVLADARREAQALISAAQKSSQELRAADIAATRDELERLRTKATADIAAERDRALADLRAQVVGETMTDARQRRLVDEFLAGDGSAQGRTN